MGNGKRVIVITGTPGTGKTKIADILKKKLKDAEVVHATELVNKKKLFSSYSRDSSKIVKMKELRKELERLIAKSSKRIVILEGHILCDISIKNAKAVVLRDHLEAIKRRLITRGYSKEKIKANLVSEATDYCGAHAERNYGKVFEMFSRSKDTIGKIIRVAEGKEIKVQSIDLLEELSAIIKKDKELAI